MIARFDGKRQGLGATRWHWPVGLVLAYLVPSWNPPVMLDTSCFYGSGCVKLISSESQLMGWFHPDAPVSELGFLLFRFVFVACHLMRCRKSKLPPDRADQTRLSTRQCSTPRTHMHAKNRVACMWYAIALSAVEMTYDVRATRCRRPLCEGVQKRERRHGFAFS